MKTLEEFAEDARRETEAEAQAEIERKERAAFMPKVEVNTSDPNFNRWMGWKLENVQNTIQNAVVGERHKTRVAGARVLGGLVASGYLGYEEAIDIGIGYTESNTETPRDAAKDIKDGVNNGMKTPIPYTFKPRERVDPDYDPKGCPEEDNNNKNNNQDESKLEETPVILFPNHYIPDRKHPPEITEPLITFEGVKLLSRGNISLFTALPGKGKSNICAAIWASTYDSFERGDTLGFGCPPKIKIRFIDTEMSYEDSYNTYDRALRRMVIEELPDYMYWVNIRGDGFKERQEYLWYILNPQNCADITIIDGIGDFVKNVNDAEETTDLVSRLCSEVHKNKIGVFTTLHANPAQLETKARGHLGSELGRKCESNITIKDGEDSTVRQITTVFSQGKVRGGLDSLSHFYTWDNDSQMHLSCGQNQMTKTRIQDNKILNEMVMGTPYKHKDLKALIMNVTGVAEKTARSKINDLETLSKIQKIGDEYYKS